MWRFWAGVVTWLHEVVRPVGRTAKFSKMTLAYNREMNIASLSKALVDIPTGSMPIAYSLKT
jgi:hypothetical protein